MPIRVIDNTRIGVRKNLRGTSERPRLCVFRSNNHMYAQLIDDVHGRTLVSSSTLDSHLVSEFSSGATRSASAIVGQSIAKKSLQCGIRVVVFDRGRYPYHGRIKALADAARSEGLRF
uniref:Large ribosomal subunit protein uL18c n=1 Tax=Cryptomonas sp. CCAC 1634B TaxID=2051848 RepID=A0A679CAE1_9CRYP|nr:ribosomal protein L18 [Cryptomonas sp. CCAC 1634B]